ncbi:Truncated adenylosuccinate synthetase [Estrella lausannensis]|uniref:Adenylosuccinate synthetase n=1 Tax=Estrella lausannensis TaxID=483423 RepID=A0A0H5DRA8_9BACT|nr:adenylosuccinate synthetase [Estrella lausannensis]CRX39107.1 Truncated adenylosuccinate synthetase [Estrella lausannensis]
MPSVVVVGTQWGDEGKGKIVDILAGKARHVVHSQRGNSAGHAIVVGQKEYKLHLIPTGILHPETRCCIGAGCVINPEVPLQVIDLSKAAKDKE